MPTVVKHFQGTENDHDQSSHAGGGSGDAARARWALENKQTVKVNIEDWLGFFGMSMSDVDGAMDYDTHQDVFEQASEMAVQEITSNLSGYFDSTADAPDEFAEFGSSVLRSHLSFGETDYVLREDAPQEVRDWVEAYLDGQDGESESPLDNLYANDADAQARFGFEVFSGGIDALPEQHGERSTWTEYEREAYDSFTAVYDRANEKLSTGLLDILQSNETVWSVTEAYLTELQEGPDYYERSFVASLDRAEAKRGVQDIVADGLKEFSGRDLLAVHDVGRFVESSPLTAVLDDPSTMLSVINDDGLRFAGDPADWRHLSGAVGTIDDPEIADAARRSISRSLVSAWAMTSNKTRVAIAVQRAAQEEFGLEDVASVGFDTLSRIPDMDDAGVARFNEERERTYQAAKPVLRKFVRAQYEATQTFLREKFPDATHIRLYRGGDSPNRYRDGTEAIEQEALSRVGTAEPVDATLMLRPMASFSMSVSRMGAGAFSGNQTMFGTDVPIERIMSTAATGNGAAIEGEFVVLGGPIAGKAAVSVNSYKDRAALDRAAYNVDPTEFIMVDGVVIPIGKSVAKHYQGTANDHDQSTHAGGRGKGRSYDDSQLTDEEKAAQPDYLKGTSWVPVRLTASGVAEVFTDDVLEELGNLSASKQDAALRRDIGRAARNGGAMFVDRARGIVAIVDGDVLSVNTYKDDVEGWVSTWDGKTAVRNGVEVDLSNEARAAAQSGIEWFDDPYFNPNVTPDEVAGQRVQRMLTTAQTLQDIADVGPVVLRIATPMSRQFESRLLLDDSEDKADGALGFARRGGGLGQEGQLPTIVMNTRGRYRHSEGPPLTDDFVVQPYYRAGVEQDTQSPYLGTLIHEWGHQVAFKRERDESGYIGRAVDAWNNAQGNPRPLTRYAMANVNELQAEAFTAWAVDRIAGISRQGKYSEFASWSDENLGISDFAGSKIDNVEFVTIGGIVVPIAKAKTLVGIGCTFDPNVGSIYEYADGTFETVNEFTDVTKHFQGTENDHDQQSHAGGGGRTPTMSNTMGDDNLFDKVREQIGLGDGGMKNRNAEDIASRLAESGASPDDLLALAVSVKTLTGASGIDTQQFLLDSAVTLSGVEVPESRGAENIEEVNAALRENWRVLNDTLVGGDLPDDVTVLQVAATQTGTLARNRIVITRDPDMYRDEYATQTLREGGEWQEGAVEALGYLATDKIMADWAGSAQGAQADAFAAAAMEELGVDISTRQSSYSAVVVNEASYYATEGRPHEGRKAVARAMYENTQQQLAERFPDSEYFILYRGASHGNAVSDPFSTIDESTMVAGGGPTAMHSVEYKPLSSWTTDMNMAESFAQADLGEGVAGAVVPRERVFSTAFSGSGAFRESEFIVIGGKMNVALSDWEYEESVRLDSMYLPIRASAGLMSAEEFIMIDGQPVPIGKSVTKHYQGTEHDHDQSSHAGGRGATGAGSVDVQGHDPYFFRDLAKSLGVESRRSLASVVSTSVSDFATRHREAVEQMIRDGEIDLEEMIPSKRLEVIQRIHAGDDSTFEALAANSILASSLQHFNSEEEEMFARRKGLADAVGDRVARELLEAGLVNLDTFENNLNAEVDRRQAKMLAQEAVASRLTDVPLSDLHALTGLLPVSVIRSFPADNWEDETVVIAYNRTDNHHAVQYIDSTIEQPAKLDVLERTLTAQGYHDVTIGSPRDAEFRDIYHGAMRSIVAREFISEWAKTSNKTGTAAALQRAAAEEFGLDRAAQPLGDLPVASEQAQLALGRVARSFVRAQYEATQAMFAEHLPDTTHIRLFRGGDSAQRYVEGAEGLAEAGNIDTYSGADVGALVRLNQAKWSLGTLNLRPMASFATTPAASNLFALRTNTTFAADVPVERILSTPFTGNGASIESEFVVLGGPIHGMRIGGQVPKVQGTPKWPIPDDLPLGTTEFIMVDGQPIPIGKAVYKHLAGTGQDHDQQSHAGGGSDRAAGEREPQVKSMSGKEYHAWAQSMGVGGGDVDDRAGYFDYDELSAEARDELSGLRDETHNAYYEDLRDTDSDDAAVVFGEEIWADAIRKSLGEGVLRSELYLVPLQDLEAMLDDKSNNYREDALGYAVDRFADTDEFQAGITALMVEMMTDEDWDKVYHRSLDRVGAKKMAQSAVADGMKDVPLEDLAFALRVTVPGWGPVNTAINADDGTASDFIINRDSVTGEYYVRTTRDTGLERIEAGAVVGQVSDPDVRSALEDAARMTFAREFIGEWANTSNRTPMAREIQRAAALEFGIEDVAATLGPAPTVRAGQQEDLKDERFKRVARSFVRAQYDATQAMLAEQFPDVTHLTLFRGGDSEARYVEAPESLGDRATLLTRPLASFSTSGAEANNFSRGAGTIGPVGVFAAAVPRERIFSTPFTGNGALIEAEFVVLGGPIHGRSLGREVYYDMDSSGPDVSDLPLGATEFIMIDGQPVPIGKAVVKHLAGKHDQKTHGRWAHGGVPHMAGDHSMIDRLRGSGAIRTVTAAVRYEPFSDGARIAYTQDGGRQDYGVEYPEQSIRRLDFRPSEEFQNLPKEEKDALYWLAKKEGDGGSLPEQYSFVTVHWEETMLGIYRDPAYTDEQAERFLASVSTFETFDIAETFLDAYRLAKADGMSEAHARSLGHAQVLRTGRYIGIENGDRAFREYTDITGEVGPSSQGDFVAQRYMPTEEQRSAAENLIINGQVAVAVHSGVLDAILSDGAMKNQYQTGESSGMYAPQKRRTYETAYIGVDVDTPAKDRPIYGYLFDPNVTDPPTLQARDTGGLGNHWVEQYGDVRVVLKPEVRDRTTVTGGDSLDRKALAVPLTGELTERDYMLGSLYAASLYHEAQIHRGVKVSDITSAHVPSEYVGRADRVPAEVERMRTVRRDVEAKFRAAGIAVPVTMAEFITLPDGTVIPIGDEG